MIRYCTNNIKLIEVPYQIKTYNDLTEYLKTNAPEIFVE